MKVTLTFVASGASLPTSYILADSPANIPCANFRVNCSSLVQEAEFFRASQREYFSRGNATTEITFETTRQFNTQMDAENFVLLHATLFPAQANVAFTAGAPGGAVASRYLLNAVVQQTTSQVLGFTTKHTYRITGGSMQTTP